MNVLVSDIDWPVAIKEIIDNAGGEAWYQPIVDMRTNEMVGVEALAHFPTLPKVSPDIVFKQATLVGMELDLDLLCVAQSLEGMAQLPDGVYMAINVSPETLMSNRLPALISHHIAREQIVLEVTEHARISNFLPLYQPLRDFRSRHVKLAMNDVGAGFAGLSNLVNLRPDIIKIDRFLIDGINSFPGKRDMVEAIMSIARNMRSNVVAEGVETAKEVEWLQAMGLRFGQGFYWARPAPDIPQGLLLTPGEGIWIDD